MKRRKLLAGVAATTATAAAGAWWLRDRAHNEVDLGKGKGGVDPLGGDTLAKPESEGRARRSRPIATGPNILMIAIDDMKPWIGPHGFTAAHTPALDAFAQQSVVFRQAYCAAPACSPSRAAVFTGLAPHQSGCYRNRDNWRDLVGGVTTFPRLLREAGYFTAGYGKLSHTKEHDDPKAWDERSFLRLYKMPGAPVNMPKSMWRKSGSHFDWQALDVPDEAMDDHQQVNRAIAAMHQPRPRPWFIACGLFRPHLPWYAPRRFFDMHPLDSIVLPEVPADDLDDVPARGRSLAKGEEHRFIVKHGLWRPAVQAYMASISYADYEVGRLLAQTPADTTIILWSDHGWHLGPKNHWHKYTLWEEASHSVFAIASPGAAAGKPCFRTVSLNDIYPTISALCDLPAPHKLFGRDVMPLVRDPSMAWDYPALTTYGENNHAIRNERYRYIRYDDGGEELYDHKIDPNEWHNLATTADAQGVIDTLAPLLPRPGTEHKGKKPKGVKTKGRQKNKGAWLELPVRGQRVLMPT